MSLNSLKTQMSFLVLLLAVDMVSVKRMSSKISRSLEYPVMTQLPVGAAVLSCK